MNEEDLGGWSRWPEVEYPLGSASTEPSWRSVAMECDAERGTAFQLGELWERLTTGEWRVEETFSARDRLYAVIEQPTYRRARRRRRRGLAMIERVLLGERAKVVAIDCAVTESTVAVAIKGQLKSMGLDCKVRATPLILVMAARAARAPRCRAESAKITRIPGDPHRWVVSVRSPKLDALDVLSSAERTVLLKLLEGKTYVEIAQYRGASKRTVANQLGTAFRKLGVSGYGETLDRLMTQALGMHGAEARS